jgi:hypothetical protein
LNGFHNITSTNVKQQEKIGNKITKKKGAGELGIMTNNMYGLLSTSSSWMVDTTVWFRPQCVSFVLLIVVMIHMTALVVPSPTASPTTNSDCDLTLTGIQCHPTIPSMVYLNMTSSMNQTRIVTDFYWGISNNPEVNETIVLANETYMFEHVYDQPGVYNLMFNLSQYSFNETSEEYEFCFGTYSPSHDTKYDIDAPDWTLTATNNYTHSIPYLYSTSYFIPN